MSDVELQRLWEGLTAVARVAHFTVVVTDWKSALADAYTDHRRHLISVDAWMGP
ncbi:hypothetical protein [Specibacter cremeus]|uniref:hypothetical protein n=1 Tax=Specibacter cremeus TaxID=1629051 RepID=UPI0013DE55B7|nr:hypothetical protein [Specibacter cremeus]